MIDAIQTATAALRANAQWLDTISGNVANINTPSYKAHDTQFSAAVQHVSDAFGNTGTPIAGLVQARSDSADIRTGNIRQTGRELDIAINGNGFFRVVDNEGNLAYTRLGHFVVNADGALAMPSGLVLADDIRIPPDALAIRIDTQGDVRVNLPDQAGMLEVGTIRTAALNDLSGMTESSSGVYRDLRDTGMTIEDGQPGSGVLGALEQGHLEYSNVDLVNEMTRLVLAQRAYQLNARVLQVGDQALETLNNLRR